MIHDAQHIYDHGLDLGDKSEIRAPSVCMYKYTYVSTRDKLISTKIKTGQDIDLVRPASAASTCIYEMYSSTSYDVLHTLYISSPGGNKKSGVL